MSSLIRRVIARLDRSIGIGVERVFLYRLTDSNAIPDLNPAPGLEITLIQPDQMDRLKEVLPTLDMADVSQTRRQGSQCYGAAIGGKLVHYSWVQTTGQHSILDAGRRVEVSPDEFWIYDCRTSSSARGLGIYSYMLTFIARKHLQQGLRQGIIYTTVENTASQRGIEKAGFTKTESLRSLRLGSRYVAF
jgi:hypothetical protein